jgi:hypothetical protein
MIPVTSASRNAENISGTRRRTSRCDFRRPLQWVAGNDLPRQIEFIDHLFDLAA